MILAPAEQSGAAEWRDLPCPDTHGAGQNRLERQVAGSAPAGPQVTPSPPVTDIKGGFSDPPTVRLAQGAEEAVGRALLPEAFRGRSRPYLVLAFSNEQLLGAAAVGPRPGGGRGLRLNVRVLRPYRRHGVGTALVRLVAAEAARCGVMALYCWQPPQEEGARAFLLSQCFQPVRQVTTFETDIAPYHRLTTRLRERVLAREGLKGTRLVPLSQASAEAVARFYCQGMGGSPARVASRILGEGDEPFCADSPVLMEEEEVAGALLFAAERDWARLDGIVVAPRLRGRGANALLLAAAAEHVFAEGQRRVRFSCHDGIRDTLKMAARSSAQVVETRCLYALELASGHGSCCVST